MNAKSEAKAARVAVLESIRAIAAQGPILGEVGSLDLGPLRSALRACSKAIDELSVAEKALDAASAAASP